MKSIIRFKMSRVLFLAFSLMFVSCGKENGDLNAFFKERIWKEGADHGRQYYFSNDGYRYFWSPSNRVGKDYLNAEGNPETNLLSIENPLKGWIKSANYKIENDSLFFQSIKDLKGEDVHKRKLEIGKDTFIGIVQYNTLKVSIHKLTSIWLSKKR